MHMELAVSLSVPSTTWENKDARPVNSLPPTPHRACAMLTSDHKGAV